MNLFGPKSKIWTCPNRRPKKVNIMPTRDGLLTLLKHLLFILGVFVELINSSVTKYTGNIELLKIHYSSERNISKGA